MEPEVQQLKPCDATRCEKHSAVLPLSLSRSAMKMCGLVTVREECNEILFDVFPQLAARADVMDLKILRCVTILAAPSIAREYTSIPIYFTLSIERAPFWRR